MSMQAETKEALRNLGLDGISTEWVDSVWDNNFCENFGLPSDDHNQLLDEDSWRNLVEVCRQWKTRTNYTDDSQEDNDAEDAGEVYENNF